MSATLAAPRSAERPAAKGIAPIVAQLRAADRVLQEENGVSFVLRSWPWICGFVLAAFVTDVLLHLGALPRLALLAGFGLFVSGILLAGSWIAWVRHHSPEHVARILESRNARLGSKLINVLQLRAQCEDSTIAPLTRELAAMAIAGYVDALRGENLAQVARTDRVRREAKRMGIGVAAFLALLATAFPITRVEVPRFLDPFGDHPPYSFTQLEIVDPRDDSAAVVYGEHIIVSAQAHGHRPGELFLTFFAPENPAARTTVPMLDKGAHGFSQQIESVRTNLIVFAHTRNGHSVSRQRRLTVILTPKLESASVRIAPPAYTGLAPSEHALQFKSLKALEGSALTFRLVSNRPLDRGRINIASASGTAPQVKMEPEGERSVAGTVVAKESAQLKFSIVDRDGFGSQETWELALTVTHDLPPDVQITNPHSDTFVAIDFRPEPVIEASDDYGIKTLRIHTARNNVFGEPRTIDYGKPPQNAREGLVFDFRKMGVAAGDRISIFAEAIDSAPEAHVARSKTVTLTVITTEEYNDFLREQMDIGDIEAKYSKLLSDFHDLVEQQKQLSPRIEALKAQLAETKTDPERAASQKPLDELLAQQERLNQQLQNLAKTMETFVRDEPVYDLEAELKNTLTGKAQEIRASVEQNEQAMQALPRKSEAQPGKPDESRAGGSQANLSPETLERFRKASDEQAERLGGAAQEAQQQVAETLQDMSLMHEIVKDLNRFKELHEAQQELAQQVKAYDRATPLSREDQLALKQMAAGQKEIGEQLDAVEQKLWEDGQAAREKFPKAAKSAQDLAQQMGDLRLQSIANKATDAMVEGSGARGAQLVDHLRAEMEKLFCQPCNKPGSLGDELDQYLTLQRGMKPGNNFKQMMQTRRFGDGSRPGFGPGKGFGGRDGNAMTTGPNADVMGGEKPVTESDKARRGGPGNHKAKPDAASAVAELDKQDVVHGVQPVNRESGAVQGEAGIEQYSDLVEKYFKAITQPAKPRQPKGQ